MTIYIYDGLEEAHHHRLILQKAEKPSVEVIGYKVEKEKDLEGLELFPIQGYERQNGWRKEHNTH